MNKVLAQNTGFHTGLAADLGRQAKPYIDAVSKAFVVAAKELGANMAPNALDVTAAMKTFLEGEVTCRASMLVDNVRLPFETKYEVKAGKMDLSVHGMVDKIKAALEARKAELDKPKAPTVAAKKRKIGMNTIEALRMDAIVKFSTPDLPGWSLVASLKDLGNEGFKAGLGERVAASLENFCQSSFRAEADFAGVEFKMPIVQSTPVRRHDLEVHSKVQAALQATAQPSGQEIQAQMKPESNYVPPTSVRLAASGEAGFHNAILAQAMPSIQGYVREKLRGDKPTVINADFSGVQHGAKGAQGVLVVAVDYYRGYGHAQANLKVPFDNFGRVDVKAVDRTEADIVAEKEAIKANDIKTQEEASRQFKAFVEGEKAKKERLGKLGVKAGATGYGSNLFQRGPADMIPVMKSLLPEEVSKEGMRIVVGGYVYALQATDHNGMMPAGSEKNCFWMLKLCPELSPKDADYTVVRSSLDPAMAGAHA
jgi:hypothetical protein